MVSSGTVSLGKDSHLRFTRCWPTSKKTSRSGTASPKDPMFTRSLHPSSESTNPSFPPKEFAALIRFLILDPLIDVILEDRVDDDSSSDLVGTEHRATDANPVRDVFEKKFGRRSSGEEVRRSKQRATVADGLFFGTSATDVRSFWVQLVPDLPWTQVPNCVDCSAIEDTAPLVLI